MSVVLKKTETGLLRRKKSESAKGHFPRRKGTPKPGSSAQTTAEFDKNNRANSYSRAHAEYPLARQAELDATLNLIGACKDKIVVEVGAGQGFLTKHLVDSFGPRGQIYAVDNARSQLDALTALCPAVKALNASTEHIPLESNFAEVVVSLANFHHVASKPGAFSECVRILKPGGTLILVDVCDGTPVQAYFDNVVDKICSTGHKHTFLDQQSCEKLCAQHKLEIDSWQMIEVPWEFDSKDAAANFLNWVHDANCPPAESLAHASEYLEIHSDKSGGKIRVGWQLFFMSARKPVHPSD